jgi:hypothetical protein
MILDYNSFKDDFLFESMINETFVYYIKDFKDILYKLNAKGNQIAKDLIDIEYTDNKSDNTFISLGKDGYVSYNRLRDLKKTIEKSFMEWARRGLRDDTPISKSNLSLLDTLLKKIENGETSQSDVNHIFTSYELDKKSRNEVKLGRFINAVLPGKYTPKDIEEFTNQFKATLEKQGEHFEEVSGEEINHWYSYENYKEMSGSLGNSCMAKKSGFFNIYVNNPEVCKMLILVEDDKLIGRAIVWKLNTIKCYGVDPEPDVWFMDRQYSINDTYVEKFRNYAKEKGWYYKSYNNHHSLTTVTIKGEEKNCDMTVKVKPVEYKQYPYMDTFKRFNPEDGTLYNDEEQDSDYEGQYILNDTGGGYEEIEGGVWSEWHDRRIPSEDAVWSEWADSYINRQYATQLQTGSRRWRGEWFPEDCDDIVFDEWIDEYLHVDDAVYSEAYGYYLYDDNAVEVIKKIDSDGEPIGSDSNWYHKDDDDIINWREYDGQTWFEVLSREYSDWVDYSYALRELFILDHVGTPIPKIFKLETYKIIGKKPDELKDIDYLSEVDALVLGVKVDNEKERVTDKYHYESTVEEVRGFIKSKLNTEVKRINDIIEDKGQLQIKFDKEEREEYFKQLTSRLERIQSRIEEIDTNKFI